MARYIGGENLSTYRPIEPISAYLAYIDIERFPNNLAPQLFLRSQLGH